MQLQQLNSFLTSYSYLIIEYTFFFTLTDGLRQTARGARKVLERGDLELFYKDLSFIYERRSKPLKQQAASRDTPCDPSRRATFIHGKDNVFIRKRNESQLLTFIISADCTDF